MGLKIQQNRTDWAVAARDNAVVEWWKQNMKNKEMRNLISSSEFDSTISFGQHRKILLFFLHKNKITTHLKYQQFQDD
jgi:hypothetical protein